MMNEELNEFYLMRKKAGLSIDPLTAEVCWSYAQTMDPYGIDPNLPDEYQQIGRQYFARSPESEICAGIPNFWNVVSNIPFNFNAMGAAGLWRFHRDPATIVLFLTGRRAASVVC